MKSIVDNQLPVALAHWLTGVGVQADPLLNRGRGDRHRSRLLKRSDSEHSLRREQLEPFLSTPDQKPAIGIQSQRGNGGSRGCGATRQMVLEPGEMLVPVVLSRMEERSELIGVGIDRVRAVGFVQIARWTAPRKIFKR